MWNKILNFKTMIVFFIKIYICFEEDNQQAGDQKSGQFSMSDFDNVAFKLMNNRNHLL